MSASPASDPRPNIRIVTGAEVDDCIAVRRAVFIDEQGVSEEEEIDGNDETCRHILARVDGQPVGAARVAALPPASGSPAGRTKLQRVCVLRSHRGLRIGEEIMAFAIEDARARGDAEIVLGAQLTALRFYERLGFSAYGEVFDDAGIPHRMMRLAL